MKIVVGVLVAVLALGGVYYYISHLPAAPTPADPPGAPAPASKDDTAKAAEVLTKAKAAAMEGDSAKARALYEQAATQFPDTWSGRQADLELGDIYLRAGLKKQALDAFRKGLPNATTEQSPVILASMKKLEEQLAAAPPDKGAPTPKAGAGDKVGAPDKAAPPAEEPKDTVYTVVKGDTLVGIAHKFAVSVEQIKLANNRTDDRLSIGDSIKISKQMPTLKVSKKGLKLQLVFKGAVAKEYPVCIGREAELTPAGDYTVGPKIKNPPWDRPGGKRVPYGDPENILGTRWMTLISADGVRRGYGVHGTTQPESVPGRASAGCIRMLNQDVEQLFEWVPMGTKVTISEE